MNVEVYPALGERARRHAALSDPSRLAVVDALALTDLSPGEVGRLLDLPSNLVAHHVKVLRDAGLVTRHRSQGDSRRCYLRLDPGAVAGLLVAPTLAAPRVVFVCRQNSARSQLAAALWRQSSAVPAESAGTHPAERVHPGAVAVARRRRLPMPRPCTHHLGDVLRPGDLLVALCDESHEELAAGGSVGAGAGAGAGVGVAGRPALHWSVPDPVRLGTDEAFDAAFTLIADRVSRVAAASSPAASSKETPR